MRKLNIVKKANNNTIPNIILPNNEIIPDAAPFILWAGPCEICT